MSITDIDKENLKKAWGEDADAVIQACEKANKGNTPADDFFNNCIACGGDLVGMFLSGVKRMWPEVYDAIPDMLGVDDVESFCNVCSVIRLCGVES